MPRICTLTWNLPLKELEMIIEDRCLPKTAKNSKWNGDGRNQNINDEKKQTKNREVEAVGTSSGTRLAVSQRWTLRGSNPRETTRKEERYCSQWLKAWNLAEQRFWKEVISCR